MKELYSLEEKKEIKNGRAAREIPRKSRNIPSCHLSSFTFLVRRYVVFNKARACHLLITILIWIPHIVEMLGKY